MTRTMNARVAGAAFLIYIGAALPGAILFGRATSGEGIAAKLAGIATHASGLRVTLLLSLLGTFSAVALGVTLRRLTRDRDPDIALLGMCFRLGEGVIGAFGALLVLGLLSLAQAAGANAPDIAATQALAALLLKLRGWNVLSSAIFFAVGSMLFSWLLLRGRVIPGSLAGLGVVASVLLVLVLPLQLAGLAAGPVTSWVWLPMLVFELALAVWLLVRGAEEPVLS